jgi:hypothetical protein
MGVAQLDPVGGALQRPASRGCTSAAGQVSRCSPALMIASTCPSVTSPVFGLAIIIAVRGSSSSTGTCSVVAGDSPAAGATRPSLTALSSVNVARASASRSRATFMASGHQGQRRVRHHPSADSSTLQPFRLIESIVAIWHRSIRRMRARRAWIDTSVHERAQSGRPSASAHSA